jgi:cation:H+ antiporter
MISNVAHISLLFLIVFFIVSAIITWVAGITLTKTTDSLDTRFNIGDALGGLILLGIGGSLPEIAITYSAARDGHIPVIIGNLLGGIAIQTLVIVIFDFALNKKKPLSYLAGTPLLSLETIFAIVLTIIALLATLIPAKNTFFKVNPLSIVLVAGWVIGLFIINNFRKKSQRHKTAPDASPGRKHHERRAVENHPFYAKKSNLQVILIFLVACIATLISGVVLEESGSEIAGRLGINSGIFAATVLALMSSLPEISTGLESIFIGDNALAISDIMGGNAFMLIIFLFADLVAAKPILSYAGHLDILFAVLGIAMMGVYAVSFMLKPQRRYLRLGIDSILQIVLYALGLLALYYIH